MSKFNSWHTSFEIEGTATGGNANVYFVKDKSTNEKYALKELRYNVKDKGKKWYKNKETMIRFKNEMAIAKENATTISGIIPIIYSCEQEYWYTMPIAEPIMQHIENKRIEEIILGVVELAETLELLHNKGISHRDIKPANIYYYNDRFSLGDFGLVDFPNNFDGLTRTDRGLGAIFTIAPEMKRNPQEADGKKADVFSLAKSMWMFLSKDEKGFDGVYNHLDSSHSLRYLDKYRDTHLVEIDELIKAATDNNPDIRPTITEFKERLKNWIDIYLDMDKSQASDWNFLNKQLFGVIPPESSSWRKVDKIIEVLNIIGRTPAYNHMLFHDKGGLDFSHAETAAENGCIKLYDTIGICYVVKPKILYFEGFDEKYKWNYFLLELDELNPIFEKNNYSDSEYLVEDSPAHYVSAQYAEYGVYDYDTGNTLPEGFQRVNRYTTGKILIVLKLGPYNGISGTYDGRHGDASADEFRSYINKLIEFSSELYAYVKCDDKLKHLTDEDIEERILSLEEINKNPFKKHFPERNNKNEMKEKFAEQEKSKVYIKENYKYWDFKTILQPCEIPSSEKIKFAFEFDPPCAGFSLESLWGENNYICTDGYIRKLKSTLEKECHFVYNRQLAINLRDKLQQKASEFLRENNLQDLEEYESCFSIKLIKSGKPTHLFTKQEIEQEMRDADDRVRNQLVIDEDGYAKVIEDYGYGYLFPVRHEPWDARNLYVGKYSKLSTLDDNYIASLQGWLLYLKSGQKQNIDYVHKNSNEEELLAKIKEYY